jgi:hypothetical protein
VTNVKDKARSSMRKISAKLAMARKCKKKRKSLKLRLIREHLMVRSTCSMEKLMSIQARNQAMW